ncbi:antibiotic biosynthesis monooxygenase family protein [Streptomyces sp. NBC_00344]|uniref:antibiotic biosynthesis monooxygenase family protein n=1 Tax=Streptomyces sp. NBC_00344 TaxID=2975720 RepID=UPI002E1F9E65
MHSEPQAKEKVYPRVIVLVNVFRVHESLSEFERIFTHVSECMRAQPGFRHHRLLGSQDAGSTYVNLAEWQDEQSLRDALARPEVIERLRPLAALATGEATVYRPVLERSSLEA